MVAVNILDRATKVFIIPQFIPLKAAYLNDKAIVIKLNKLGMKFPATAIMF